MSTFIMSEVTMILFTFPVNPSTLKMPSETREMFAVL